MSEKKDQMNSNQNQEELEQEVILEQQDVEQGQEKVDHHEKEIEQDQASQQEFLKHEDQQDSSVEQEDTSSNDQSYTEITLWKDQCRRISAEFENFKKRTDRDQVRWSEIAKESILKELLSLVDDFDRAIEQSGDDNGMKMIQQSFMKLLEKHGVKVMGETVEFNPEFHEAIMQVESADHESGQVVQILSKGFMIKDRVLRPAKVSVAQ